MAKLSFNVAALAVLSGCISFAGSVSVAFAQSSENPAVMPAPRTAGWWMERHEQKLGRIHQGKCDLLFIGDSITQNYEKTGPAPNEVFYPTWEFFYGARRAVNLGFSGDETTQVLWRLDHGEVDGVKPKVAVLMIGTNNTGLDPSWTAEQDLGGVEAVVAEIRQRLPKTKILLLAILPSDRNPQKTANDDSVNEHLKTDYAGSRYVTFLDIGHIFFKDGQLDTSLYYDPKLNPPGGALHPNSHGQAMMAAAIEPTLSRLMKDKSRLSFAPLPTGLSGAN